MSHAMFRTCLAVLVGLVLAVTGLWAAGEEEQPAAADAAGSGQHSSPSPTGNCEVAWQIYRA